MRKQYHWRGSDRGLLAWDVDRLVELAVGLPVVAVELGRIREIDEAYWFDHGGVRPTGRVVLDHMKLVREADLAYPIVLSEDGGVMDGMHRVLKALDEGRQTIDAVQFERDPEPDCVGRSPDDVPY